MVSTILMTVALLGADDSPAARPTLEIYRAELARTGKTADAQVRLALWCEAHGLSAERLKHLSLAVLYDPSSALARGLLGLVAFQGKWERPDQVSRDVLDDARKKTRLQEYLQRRAKALDRADDQWKLAVWCEQNDLKAQATAHWFRVVQLDPSRDAAWKHLGFKRIGGHWDKPERVAATKAEAQRQHQANNHWKPILEKLQSGLASKDKARHAEAEKSLTHVSDPRAVPMIWVAFVNGGAQHQKLAVRLLGQIDAPGSSRALALLAFTSRSAEVRSLATQILRQRDPRDFAPFLIALFRDPVKYEVRPVNGPGSQGQLIIKQQDVNVKRLYSPLSVPNIPLSPSDRFSLDANGLPMMIRDLGPYQVPLGFIGNASPAAVGAIFGLPTADTPADISARLTQAGLPAGSSQKLAATVAQNANSNVIELAGNRQALRMATGSVNREIDIPIGQMTLDAQRSAVVAEEQLANDVRAIDDYNGPIAETNRQVRQVLTDSIGIDPGPERTSWEKWLVDLSGYAYSAPRSYSDQPTVIEEVPLSYQPQAVPFIVDQKIGVIIQRHSCFAAGTLVRTLDGSSEIEKLRAGDLVLTQAPKTGELKYQPIVIVYHNPPNATLRIDMGHETIVATGIHRFWKAGRGWIMARDLKPGDVIRALGGVAVVKSVETDRVQPVFNLQVADGESFFVGLAGLLAHDNSLVSPTPSPFDAVPEPQKSATP